MKGMIQTEEEFIYFTYITVYNSSLQREDCEIVLNVCVKWKCLSPNFAFLSVFICQLYPQPRYQSAFHPSMHPSVCLCSYLPVCLTAQKDKGINQEATCLKGKCSQTPIHIFLDDKIIKPNRKHHC